MKKIVTSILIFMSVISYAQQPILDWVQSFGSSAIEQGMSIATDPLGNVYTTGIFKDTVDFDPNIGVYNLSSASSDKYDVYVTKIDSNGNLMWAESFGGALDDFGRGITTDNSGNVYLTGQFFGTVDFDPGIATQTLTSGSTYRDLFILKLSSAGSYIWVKSIESDYEKASYVLEADGAGNVYVGGDFKVSADFDPGVGISTLTSNGFTDIFIQKLDINGDFVWVKSLGSTGYDFVADFVLDASNNVIATGGFEDTVDFDPGVGVTSLYSKGGYDNYIFKLDANGDFLWAKSMGGVGSDNGSAIGLELSGNIFCAGSFNDTADFDPGVGVANLYSNGGADIFIQKLDVNGDFVWAKSIGGIGYDVATSIELDNNGGLYMSGGFEDTVDFNPSAAINNFTSNGVRDLFIQKLDVNGDFQWVKTMGSDQYDNAVHIVIDDLNNIYGLGTFNDTLTFNDEPDSLISAGLNDVFLLKLSLPSNVGVSENNFTQNLNLYPNPTNGQFNIDLGESFTQTNIQLVDVSGKIVYQTTIENKQIINLNFEAPKGIYFVSINTGLKQSIIKLIKQ
jgi:hypothetical protein